MSWKKLIPNAELQDTQKKYFGRYLYKLELLAYGARSINATNSIEGAIKDRIQNYRRINYGGSWQYRVSQELKKADYDWLNFLRQCKFNLGQGLKLRIEEPKIQIYSETQDQLKEFVRNIPAKYRHYALNVFEPADDQQRTMLESGLQLVKNPPKYRYKIILRDGKYGAEIKHNILNYLTALDDAVKVPDRCRGQLDKTNFGYVWDCYFYTNDSSITTFVRLIHPDLIRSITEMASVAQINTDSEEI